MIEDWLKWRRQGIGASDVGVLFGCHPFATKNSIWKNIVTPEEVERKENHLMRKGHELESILFPRIRYLLGIPIKEQVCLTYKPFPVIRCTLDGFSECGSMVFEIKYISNKEKFYSMMAPPKHHYLQLQQQLLVSGALIAFYIFSHDRMGFRCFVVPKDEHTQEKIKEKIKHFWETYVLTGKEPSDAEKTKPKRVDFECVSRCNRLLELKPLVEEFDALKEELRNLGGDNPYSCNGVKYGVTPVKGTIRYKEIFQLPCVQKAIRDNGYLLEQFTGPDTNMKRIYFSSNEED